MATKSPQHLDLLPLAHTGRPGIRLRGVALFMDNNTERLGIAYCNNLAKNRVVISPGLGALVNGSTRKITMRRKVFEQLPAVEVENNICRLVRKDNKVVALFCEGNNVSAFEQMCAVLTSIGGRATPETSPRKISVDAMTIECIKGETKDYMGVLRASKHHEIVVYEDRGQSLSYLLTVPPEHGVPTVPTDHRDHPVSNPDMSGSERLQLRIQTEREEAQRVKHTDDENLIPSMLSTLGRVFQAIPSVVSKKLAQLRRTKSVEKAVEDFLKPTRRQKSEPRGIRTKADMGQVEAPKFIPVHGPRDHTYNALMEFLAVTRATRKVNTDTCEKIIQAYRRDTTGLLRVLLDEAEAAIYDNDNAEVLMGSMSGSYMAAYSGSCGFVASDEERTEREGTPTFITPSGDPIVVVAKSMLDDRILKMANTVLGDLSKSEYLEHWTTPTFSWVNGVPGCGKTTWIISNFDVGKDIIVTTTTQAAKDLREKLVPKIGDRAKKRVIPPQRGLAGLLPARHLLLFATVPKTYVRPTSPLSSMKVESDGMVAIIQGLRDAGLAVTLLGRGNAEAAPITRTKSSVETRARQVDASAQLNDAYVSSYQVAHCNAKPSSPCPNASEFPRRRKEGRTTQGNFEIGDQTNMNSSLPITISFHPHSGLTSPDRGTLSNTQSSKGTVTFVNSLRKYPTVIPEKISSEFVQQLITYTQAKNFTKSAFHCKNRKKFMKERIAEATGKFCKGVQTNDRTIRKEDSDLNDTRNINARRYRSTSPEDWRDVRCKDIRVRETYDYLSARRYRSRDSDVRYLSDVTRCLRDTLRQIYDDQTRAVFQVCPSIQDRYSRHRREHHRDCMSRRSSSDSNNMEAQVSVPMVSRGVSCLSSCDAMPGTYMPVCPKQPERCCYCQKPLPCYCLEKSAEELFNKQLEEAVCQWLEELPVAANDRSENKTMREILVMDLIDKLKSLHHGEFFEKNAKNEITQCVNSLPIWCPGSKKEQQALREKMIDNLMNKIRCLSSEYQQYKKEIANWLDGILFNYRDSQGKIVDVETAKEDLVEKLGLLALSPPSDDDELKSKVFEILQEFPIEVEKGDDTYIDDLAQTLADKIQTLPSKVGKRESTLIHDAYDKEIGNWLKDIPGFSRRGSTQKQVEALTAKLHKLQAQGIDDEDIREEMQNEINDWLERNVDDLDPKTKKNLTAKLMKNLEKASKDVVCKQTKTISPDQILKWLENIPELSESKSENQRAAQQLANTLQELVKANKNESDIENEISGWITKKLNSKGERLNSKTLNNLVKKLMTKINAERPVSASDEEDLTNNILNILKDIPDLDLTPNKSKKMAGQLARKIHELHTSGDGKVSEDDLKDNIEDWLSDLSDTTGIKFTPSEKENLTSKLLSVATNIPKQRKRWSKQGDLKKIINDQIAYIFDNSALKLDTDTKEEMQKKITDLVTKNINKIQLADSDDIKTEIVDILEEDGGLTNRKAKQIADDIISKANTVMVPKGRTMSQEKEFKKTLHSEVTNILDSTEIDNKDEVDSKISNILADQALRGESDEKTRERLMNVLKNSNLSEEEAEKVATQLMGMEKDLSEKSHIQPDVTPTFSSFTPSQRQAFIDNAQNEITDFTESLIGDRRDYSPKMFKFAAAKLAERVGDIISDSNTTSADKEELLNDEVLQYFDDVEISAGPKHKEQAKKLVDRLQNIAFKTSTPRSSNAATVTGFRRRGSVDPTMSTILEDNSYNQYKQPLSKQEKEYMTKLSNKIDSWLNKLPINFDMKEGKGFKETMIKDLAGDIVDRQKYLQLNPNAKTSEAEELEHLKYQVFRWLNKLPDVQQIMPSIAKTNELMALLKGVSVPQLIKDKGFAQTASSQQTSDFGKTSNLSSIQDEISNWFEAVPSHLFTSEDKSHQQRMIKELADNIDEYQKNNTLTESALDQLILDWLQKMITGNSQSLKNKSQGLKDLLINKGIVSFLGSSLVNTPVADIDEWIQSLPLKARRTSTDMKQMERVKQDFIQNLKEIPLQYPLGSPNYETKMKEAIKKYLQLFPIEPNKRKDQAFLQQKVDELFNKLKFSMAQNQFVTPSGNFDESKELVNDWISNLPFKPGKTIKDVKKDVDNFVAAMKDQFKNKNIDETNVELLDKVQAFLKTLPLQQNLVTDDHAKDLVAKIIASLKSSIKPSVTNAADIFYNDIESWCDSLPIFGGDTPEEIEKNKALKQNIISKVLNKIGDLNMKPEIFHDDTLYEDLLRDEIDDLISPFLQTPELKNNMENFKDNLIDKVRQAKQKAQNEMEAHAYKQQLRAAISTTLPSIDKTAVEEQVPFEILKDNVADAFINLNYTPDKELKNKYQNKIGDEINKFCNDYLKRYPASPVDPKTLNENLYTALQKVPRPKDDTIKSQVEQVRIKDQIHDWLKDIPLEDETLAQQLQKNKIVSVLANELHETEKEKQTNPDIDVDGRFKQDIVKWTKKLPLKPEAKDKLDSEVDKLIEKLKSTEGSRRFSISNLKRASILPQYQMPPSSLSKDDRAHLDRIRQRTQRSPGRRPFNMCLCKDASVNPIPIDAGSQTEMRIQPLSPNVNVNEYNWNSTAGSNVWDGKSGPQSGSPYPNMVGRSDSPMSQQQMPSPHLPQEIESMQWPPTPERSSSLQQNQDESLASLQPVPCSPMPPPCLSQAPPPPCMPQTTQPSMPQPTQPCMPQPTNPCMMPPPPCEKPPPPCTKPPPSCMSSPPFVPSQPPCSPYPQSYGSYSPYVSPPPCERPSPLPCQRPPPPCSPVATSTQPCVPPQPSRIPSPPWTLSYGPQRPSSIQQNPCYPSAPPPCFQSGSGAQRRKRPQFYMKSSDFSSTSTPAEDYDGQLRCPPRVTRLGSLDTVPPCKRTFGNQTEGKIPCAPPVECEWGREEDGYFGVPCQRPLEEFTRVGQDDRPTCRCKKRCLGKPLGGKGRGKLTPCVPSNSMKHCSKCCGVHCPHPSYLFFR